MSRVIVPSTYDEGPWYFDNEEQCRLFLYRKIEIYKTDPPLDQFIRNAVEYFEDTDSADNQRMLDLRVRRWTVRSSDLKLLVLIKTVFLAFVAANFVVEDIKTSSLVAVLCAKLDVLITLYKRGYRLDDNQLSVFLAIECCRQPISFDDLLIRINFLFPEQAWSSVSLRRTLNSLTQAFTKAGLISFVECNSEDEWFITP